MQTSFILPANGQATPKSIERRRKMAEAMMQSGMSTSPIASHWQGGARLAQALMGGLASNKADSAEAAGQQSARDAMLKALNGGDKASMIDAVNNPFMSNAGMSMIGSQWDRMNQPPPNPELKDLGNGQFMQYDPRDPQGSNEMWTPEGYTPPGPKFRPATAEEKAQYGVAPEAPLVIGEDGKPTILSDGKTTINNNVDMKGESAYAVDRNKGFAKIAQEIDTSELSAQKSLNSLAQMEALIADPSFYSGFGNAQVLALKRMTAALGGDPNSVSSMEQFNTLSKQAALDNMGGSLGTGFSNADRDFVVEQVAQLGNTPDGNKAIIGINRKMMQRKIEIARMAREYEAANGRVDNGFMQQLSEWAEANPLFTGSPAAPATNLQQGGAPNGPQRNPSDPLGLR